MIKINNLMISGNLCADPEEKDVGEHTLAKFSLANNMSQDKVNFIDVECWNKTAELVLAWCQKGTEVVIEGTLKEDRWAKDGQKRSKHVIRARLVHFVSRTKARDDDGGYRPPVAKPQEPLVSDGGELPF